MNVTEWKDVDEEQNLVWGFEQLIALAVYIYSIIRLQTFGLHSMYAMSAKKKYDVCLYLRLLMVKVFKIGKDVIQIGV